ncbi:uncharacterized protein LACBIDRAFT_297203 [Laccaria bicolor S238N-H82]|uniref:Predicted protein n=1 Tax=Laccaria bicolor (strain S238N-H82 / ATCC MYA-4686) TaxID=486041 RepID=B0DA88_LACBS|nr:uncharacterized protein LACBIDRAFT_297203 [Laccaria bicolor S238N-H82]EDR08712.1 predicted protein [Laccaria bicolor S238N-H82]|eukprot:XP_001880937.1 predicted protein [Laccaria bicolor S238N-H82]
MTQLSSMRQTRSRARDVKREDEVDAALNIMQGADTPTVDDSAWEDEDNLTTQSRNTTPLRQNRSGTPRKRRTKPGSSPRKQQFATPVPKPPTDEGSVATREQIANPKSSTDGVAIKEQIAKSALEGAVFTGRYLLDVVGTALFLMRKPLSVLLGLFLLSLILVQAWTTIQGAFAPLCILPGISRTAICRRNTRVADSDQQAPRWADYSRLVDVQSRTFEELLEESLGGSSLSLEIKKAEMATTDLVTLVRVSNFKSRDMLAESLVEFVDDAKKTGRGLQKLTSKIGGAVDNVMAVNDYALHAIEEAQAKAPSRFSLQSLSPWTSARRSTKEVVAETFGQAMNVLSGNMQRLILEAETSLVNLNSLEERLTTLQEMVTREDSSLSTAKEELLVELWTKLGGNRKTLRGFEKHLILLKDLNVYRKQALVHVVAALQTLQSMSEDMEDLRERVAAPDLVGSQIPVEVHMRSIRNGLERLREGRIRAKHLSEEAMYRVLGGERPED